MYSHVTRLAAAALMVAAGACDEMFQLQIEVDAQKVCETFPEVRSVRATLVARGDGTAERPGCIAGQPCLALERPSSLDDLKRALAAEGALLTAQPGYHGIFISGFGRPSCGGDLIFCGDYRNTLFAGDALAHIDITCLALYGDGGAGDARPVLSFGEAELCYEALALDTCR